MKIIATREESFYLYKIQRKPEEWKKNIANNAENYI